MFDPRLVLGLLPLCLTLRILYRLQSSSPDSCLASSGEVSATQHGSLLYLKNLPAALLPAGDPCFFMPNTRCATSRGYRAPSCKGSLSQQLGLGEYLTCRSGQTCCKADPAPKREGGGDRQERVRTNGKGEHTNTKTLVCVHVRTHRVPNRGGWTN